MNEAARREAMMERSKEELREIIQDQLDEKTKPLGALGRLEELAIQIAIAQNTPTPSLRRPHLVLFAGDHGLAAAEGISAYPQEVTAQMIENFLAGGAAVSVLARQHGLELLVVDAGVAAPLHHLPSVVDKKIGPGTRNMRAGPAMTRHEAELAIERGGEVAAKVVATGCNVIGFGEMGIGNTSASALLTSHFTGQSIERCVGRGTGIDDDKLTRKISILSEIQKNNLPSTTIDALAHFGGFEIAMMTGAILQAAKLTVLILIDGFICSAAALVAHAIDPSILDHCVFCHRSAEAGHLALLDYLSVKPLLDLELRLGEGSGVALAYPLLVSSLRILQEMATFSSAGVSTATVGSVL